MLIPLWESAPWWQLVCPNTNHFSNNVVDWVWLPSDDLSLLVAVTAPRRAVLLHDWPVMAVRVDFMETRSSPLLSKRERCIREGFPDYGCLSWHRHQ